MPNFEKLVTRILVKYVPGLEHIFSKVSNHVEHKYSKQMSQKSKVVSAHFFTFPYLYDTDTIRSNAEKQECHS